MKTLSDERILQAAADLEPRWRDLLGDSGATAAQSLLQVAGKDQAHAQEAANQLLDLFEQQSAKDALRERIRVEPLTKGGSRLYTPPPGQASPIATPGVLYRCPVPGCGVTWELQVNGQTVPYCSKHPNQRLIPK
jgi:rubrerythrin